MVKLRYGNTNTYFLNGLLIDTDMPGTLPGLQRELKRYSLSLRDVRYVLCTHYHPDHMGLVSTLADMGVTLLLSEHQKRAVHFSDKIFARQPSLPCRPVDESRAAVFSCGESRAFLAELGIAGEIVPTLSHSLDGIALVTDEGDAFVGDLEPEEYAGGYDDPSLLLGDWESVLSLRPKTAHFGHYPDRAL